MKYLTIFILCSLFFALSSCKIKKDIQYIDRISYIDKLKIDSIYVSKSDSVYIYKLNDTVYVSKFRTEYKNKYTLIRDTVIKRDSLIFKSVETKTVQVEKKLSLLQKVQIISGNIFLLIISILIIYFIVKNAIKLKTN